MSAAVTNVASEPWYRQPMVWLIIAIPLSSVVMGGVLLWLSISSYDGLVADDYYKRGLEINRVLDRDRVAAGLGLAAKLRLDPGGTRLLLSGGGSEFSPPERVDLVLSYATRAGLDRRVTLAQVSPGDYVGPVLALADGRWYAQVTTDAWRITGILEVPGSGRLNLAPVGAQERR